MRACETNLTLFRFNTKYHSSDLHYYFAGLDRVDNARNGNACRTKEGNREILQTFQPGPFPMTWIHYGVEYSIYTHLYVYIYLQSLSLYLI